MSHLLYIHILTTYYEQTLFQKEIQRQKDNHPCLQAEGTDRHKRRFLLLQVLGKPGALGARAWEERRLLWGEEDCDLSGVGVAVLHP